MTMMKRIMAAAVLLTALSVLAGPDTEKAQTVRIDFSRAKVDGKAITGWTYKGKWGTDDAKFTIRKMDGVPVLRMSSQNGSGSLLYDISKIDLKKYPWMRWKWRVDINPTDADGDIPEKDDQAIGVYVGAGSTFSQKSIALRWEVKTPKGKSGFVKYGMGAVKVHWRCIRNEKDGLKRWYVDECNIYEELNKIFEGDIPRSNIAITLSANSQYTGTASDAYLEYIEFSARPLDSRGAAKK